MDIIQYFKDLTSKEPEKPIMKEVSTQTNMSFPTRPEPIVPPTFRMVYQRRLGIA